MNICMYTNTYLPHVGGVARSVKSFAEDLRGIGCRVLVIAPVYPDYETHDKAEKGVLRVPAIQNFNGSDFSMRIPVPFYVAEKIDEFAPDIFHSHHPYLLGDAALRAARRRRLPIVFTHHTMYEEYTHYVTKDSENMRRFASILSTRYANMCDMVVAPSQSIADLIRCRGVETPIAEIPTGVDLDFFSEGDGRAFRNDWRITESAFVVGHVGRLAPEKNIQFLADAVSRAMRDLPDIHFLVVGDGPEKTEIRRIFRKSRLEDRLTLTGSLKGKPLAHAYHAMNLFVFASHTETQGMVLTEAMAAGMPVIALDAAGAREVVRNDTNGLLLPGDSSKEAFALALRKSVSHPEIMATWRRGVRMTAVEFSRKVCAEKLRQTYESILAQEKFRSAAAIVERDRWDMFLLALRTEWELIAQKAKTVVQAVTGNEMESGLAKNGFKKILLARPEGGKRHHPPTTDNPAKNVFSGKP